MSSTRSASISASFSGIIAARAPATESRSALHHVPTWMGKIFMVGKVECTPSGTASLDVRTPRVGHRNNAADSLLALGFQGFGEFNFKSWRGSMPWSVSVLRRVASDCALPTLHVRTFPLIVRRRVLPCVGAFRICRTWPRWQSLADPGRGSCHPSRCSAVRLAYTSSRLHARP